jgi:hypothetical protein
MAAFTIVLPHKRNPGNDRALAIALDCLFTNTVEDFHLLIDAATDEPLYPRITRLIDMARTEVIVYTCSDIFHAPGWDIPMLNLINATTFVTGVLTEPGAMAPHLDNVHRDYGRRPETFRRAEFEAWATTTDQVPTGIGFPAPFMFSRSRFFKLGGFEMGLQPDHQGFTGADELLFERNAARGGQNVRAKAYFYHLQRFSELSEQTKEGR